ncbi:tetratricopeptide repeat protein [Nannocystis pusilla]|uniref:tetratricopeptide repeat protein n=1 Tax=Nannocystis pusilla TaxID=889268 RepID=UPI003BF35907
MPGPRSAIAATLGCLTLVATLGCARPVLRVETVPAGAEVTVDGETSREQRWSVSDDDPIAVLAKWPDGKQVSAQVYIEHDAKITLRRDGEPGQVVGARVVGMAPSPPPGPGDPAAAPPDAQLGGPLPPPPSTVTPGPGDPMAKARKLYDEGQKAYELTDFDVAIEKFRAAYELIRSSNDPAAPEVLGAVIFNLAVVYERSYEVTPDPERLRRARVMYRQYDEQMASIQANWAKSSEHADVLARIRALEARLGPQK